MHAKTRRMPSRVGRQKGGWIAEVAEACGYLPCATNGVSCATIRDYWIFFRFDTMTHPNAVLRWLAGFISAATKRVCNIHPMVRYARYNCCGCFQSAMAYLCPSSHQAPDTRGDAWPWSHATVLSVPFKKLKLRISKVEPRLKARGPCFDDAALHAHRQS